MTEDRAIDDVAGHAGSARRLLERLRLAVVACIRDGDSRSGETGYRPFARLMEDGRLAFCKGRHPAGQRAGRCMDVNLGTRRGEQLGLPGRGVAAARDDRALAGQIEEDRQHGERADPRRLDFTRLPGDGFHREAF